MLQHGLINRVVPKGTALQAALALAGEITENSPLGVRASKEIIQRSADWTTSEMFERQRAIMEAVLASEDVREGAAAFAEKRKPFWRGR
jgi:enoyl-CoA hydratase